MPQTEIKFLKQKEVTVSDMCVSLAMLSYSTRFIYLKVQNFVLENKVII